MKTAITISIITVMLAGVVAAQIIKAADRFEEQIQTNV